MGASLVRTCERVRDCFAQGADQPQGADLLGHAVVYACFGFTPLNLFSTLRD